MRIRRFNEGISIYQVDLEKVMPKKLTIDAMVSEFSLEAPNKVSITQYTSYHSKDDPSNSVFAFTDDSLRNLVDFFNEFQGFYFKISDFKFLDMRDDFYPN